MPRDVRRERVRDDRNTFSPRVSRTVSRAASRTARARWRLPVRTPPPAPLPEGIGSERLLAPAAPDASGDGGGRLEPAADRRPGEPVAGTERTTDGMRAP